MKNLIGPYFLFIASLGLFSCVRPEPFDVAQTKKSIEVEISKYSKAIQEGNVAGVVAAYTDDAVLLPPGGEMIRGKQAIEELYTKFLQTGMKEVALTTIEVGGSGDTAYEIGKTKVRIQPEGQEVITDSTKYLVVWKRQVNGTWKVHVDIWNFSAPMPGR